MKRGDVAILTIAVAILAGGGGFALGHVTTAKSPTTASAASRGQGGFGMNGGGFRRGGGFGTRGTVSTISGNTITITDDSGATKTISVTSSTSYLNGADRSQAALSDVTTGTTILAAGQTASDGSISATRIIINPPAPGNFGNGGGQAQAQ